MKKTINVKAGKFTLIRCDRFKPGSLDRCDSAFKALSHSMQKNIKEARTQGWVLGKRDLCEECHRNPFK